MPENIAYAEPSAPSDEPARDETAREEPVRDECLRCYLVRMIRVHGCDNTKKWTTRWRGRCAPRDGQLMGRLEERGGICCDCEVLFNVWQHEETDWLGEEDEGPWRPQEGDSRQLLTCPGAASEDPLVPCARWRGWSVSEPYDPDDDDDYDDIYEQEL
jgi:Protein of unknown function (DUF2695)